MEAKQTEYRRGAGQGRLSVVTLKAGDAQRRRGVTPALSDNFLAVEIAGVFPANQMLWTAVSHPNKGEDDAAWSWRVVPN
jgi:hypothetical protein